jgi:hypothetical protein
LKGIGTCDGRIDDEEFGRRRFREEDELDGLDEQFDWDKFLVRYS